MNSQIKSRLIQRLIFLHDIRSMDEKCIWAPKMHSLEQCFTIVLQVARRSVYISVSSAALQILDTNNSVNWLQINALIEFRSRMHLSCAQNRFQHYVKFYEGIKFISI